MKIARWCQLSATLLAGSNLLQMDLNSGRIMVGPRPTVPKPQYFEIPRWKKWKSFISKGTYQIKSFLSKPWNPIIQAQYAYDMTVLGNVKRNIWQPYDRRRVGWWRNAAVDDSGCSANTGLHCVREWGNRNSCNSYNDAHLRINPSDFRATDLFQILKFRIIWINTSNFKVICEFSLRKRCSRFLRRTKLSEEFLNRLKVK